ncbi:hypothetical protein UVUMRFZT_CDS0145 [Staphylococcus phage LJLAME001]
MSISFSISSSFKVVTLIALDNSSLFFTCILKYLSLLYIVNVLFFAITIHPFMKKPTTFY